MKTTFTKKQTAELIKLGFEANFPDETNPEYVEFTIDIKNPLFTNMGVYTDGETIGIYCDDVEGNKEVLLGTYDYSGEKLLQILAYLSGIKTKW